MIWSKKKFKILILGAGRGGTSLINALLDAHPDLEIAAEVHAFEHLVKGAQGPDLLEAKERLNNFIKACEKDAYASHFPAWGNKITTEQLSFLESESTALETQNLVYQKLCASKKIVFITRDGRNCISSKMQRTQCDLNTAVNYWKHSVNYLRFLRSQADAQLYTLKFEDLILAPEETLGPLCEFLNIPYHPEMLSGTSSNRILSEYRLGKLDSTKIEIPGEASSFTPLIRSELEYLDYQV